MKRLRVRESTNMVCDKCKGHGLVKIKPYVCINCKDMNVLSCTYCENINKSPWGECQKCYGAGKIRKSMIKNNKLVYINDKSSHKGKNI